MKQRQQDNGTPGVGALIGTFIGILLLSVGLAAILTLNGVSPQNKTLGQLKQPMLTPGLTRPGVSLNTFVTPLTQPVQAQPVIRQ